MNREKSKSAAADDLSFAEIMERQERCPKIRPDHRKASAPARKNIRRAAVSSAVPPSKKSKQNDSGQTSVSSDYCYKGSGCQNKKFQRLKQGKMKIIDTCDLHGDTIEQARRRLSRFLHGLVAGHHECVLVVCGKGLHSPGREPIIKNAMAAFMQEHAMVLAYCPALQKDGGHGAFYVLVCQS